MLPATAEFYTYGFDFASTIEAGADAEVDETVNTRHDFSPDAVMGHASLASASSGSIAGTPLPRYPEPNSVANVNNLAFLSQIFIEIRENDTTWFDSPVPMTHICGTADRPYPFVQRPRVGAGKRFIVRLINKSPKDIKAYVSFPGYHIPKGK